MATTTYHNPIVPGFAPDPSVVYVESEGVYFLVNSSFHLFPGLPIYASTDLQDWKHIGNAINRSQQLSLSHAKTDAFPWGLDNHLIAVGGLFAPTIRWHKGTFYVVCTNCVKGDGEPDCRNFYVTTTDIWANKWSDPIYFDFQGIDPSMFFDDDGRAYIQGSWRDGPLIDLNCTIRQFEIDIATGKALSETKQIWEGFAGKKDVEGPHIYKKDGLYYLIGAECGTFEHHAITVARSGNVWGPYETGKSNPLVTASGKDEYIQNTGHGELFKGHDDRWWAVCLGVRNENGSFPMGRETFLMPVSWHDGAWPVIQHPRMTFSRDTVPGGFTGKKLKSLDDAGMVFVRNPVLGDYKISGNVISMIPRPADLSTPTGNVTFIGEKQRLWTCTLDVTLQITGPPSSFRAGLSVYKDEFRHAEILYDAFSKKVILSATIAKEGRAVHQVLTAIEVHSGLTKLDFRVKASKDSYCFSYAEGSSASFSQIGVVTTRSMTANDFTGTLFGMFAQATDQKDAGQVTFQNFTIK